MRYKFLSLIVVFFISGCSAILKQDVPDPRAVEKSAATKPKLEGTGRPTPASAMDIASDAERAAALKPVDQDRGQLIGVTIAALGNPATTGFWLKTSLVDDETNGRVVHAVNGSAVNLTLIPLHAEGGSQLSLSAMRAIEQDLSALIEIKVYRRRE